jgi:hypothetical protein
MTTLRCNQTFLGRFGNCVGGLMNLFLYAVQHDFAFVKFKIKQCNIPGYKIIQLNKYKLIDSNIESDETIRDMFSDKARDGILHIYNPMRCEFIPYYDLRDIGHKYICDIIGLRITSKPCAFDEALVIHMRSEDIFGGRVGSMVDLYVQPPFVFYKKVIESTCYNKVVVVSSPDFNNPCIPMIRDLCNTKNIDILLVSTSVKDDFELISNCCNLVLSTSTFAFYAAMLNKKLSNLYVFKTQNFFHNVPRLHHLNLHTYHGNGYLVRFTNSKQDVDTILTFPESNLIKLPNTSDTIGI